MHQIIISTEFLSAVFLIIILNGTGMKKVTKDLSTKLFILSVGLLLFFSITDAISYLMDDNSSSVGCMVIANTLSYIGADFIMLSFGYYAWALVNEKRRTSIWFAHVITIGSLIDGIFIITGAITGNLFYISEGQFVYGPWNQYCGIAQIILMAYFFVMILLRRKNLGLVIVVSIGTYFIFPTAAIILENINPEWSFTYVSMAIVMMIIYVVIQSGEIDKRQLREAMMLELLYTDGLTLLNNRRAYEEKLNSMNGDKEATVLFCDLNGLKYTNDNMGHTAGDQLLIRFTEILTKYFDSRDVYRISGDEFIVVMEDTPKAKCLGQIDFFRKDVINNNWIAATGVSCGPGKDILNVIAAAERQMYNDKKEYYVKTGRDRRH